jgi:hypothetical protein
VFRRAIPFFHPMLLRESRSQKRRLRWLLIPCFQLLSSATLRTELDTPTTAAHMPAKLDSALDQLLGYERFSKRSKAAYV